VSKNALLIYTNFSTFVEGDASIIEKRYILKHYRLNNQSRLKLFFALFKQLVYLLFNAGKFRFIYIWFADYHAYLPTLIGKLYKVPVFIVIGGYDICRERRLNYGSFANPLRAWFTINSIKKASLNLCVSQNVQRVVKNIAPNANNTLLYNGTNFSDWVNNDSTYDKLSNGINTTSKYDVLSVALIPTLKAFYIKGIDRYNSLARIMPDISFILIGCNKSLFTQAGITPAQNLTLLPKMEQSELKQYYHNSHVYCQLSRRESFSLSLAEAMSHNCIPVVANTGGMPEVTGDLGFIVNGSDIKAVKESIRQALSMDKSPMYSQRIINCFSLQIREEGLNKILPK